MFIRSVQIRNIRSLAALDWRLPESASGAGWHVIVGDNGTGKSSFLKALGLALVGPILARALRQPLQQWVTYGETTASVAFDFGSRAPADRVVESKSKAKQWDYELKLHVRGMTSRLGASGIFNRESGLDSPGNGFSASFGPFRRFRGGDPELQLLMRSEPLLGRHLSLFDESVAFGECVAWLKELKFKSFEKDAPGAILKPLIDFINQDGFLPDSTCLTDITSDAVRFLDGKGATVEIDNLSDGYRSILSLTLELIRQLAQAFGPDKVFDKKRPNTVTPAGVVLIDEIDAHLHPTWQRRVGEWFRTRFPNIQFIVTTHSPIICQAANPGSVYRLPRPGTDEKGRFIKGHELKRLLYGSIEEAYGTEVFGDGITRSTASLAMLDELAALNVRELDEELTAVEKTRLKELRSILPTVAYTTANGK